VRFYLEPAWGTGRAATFWEKIRTGNVKFYGHGSKTIRVQAEVLHAQRGLDVSLGGRP